MRKQTLLNSLILVCMLFIITGCTKFTDSKETFTLGNTVETDIIKFKLVTSKYTYVVENITGKKYGMPKEYDADSDSNNPFVAEKGTTLASFTFCLENTDRADIKFDTDNNSKFVEVFYDNKKYENNDNNKLRFVSTSEDYLNWQTDYSDYLSIQPGKKLYVRAYVKIPTDVKNLNDTVELNFFLPASNNQIQEFRYTVTEDSRNNYYEEISEDVAIKNLKEDVVRKYFEKHLDEYSFMDGDEIKLAIEDKRYNTTLVTKVSIGVSSWEGFFTFEPSGKIYESGNKYATGYANQRTWKIEDSNLILSFVPPNGETKVETYRVKKVREKVYLLLIDNNVSGILYI